MEQIEQNFPQAAEQKLKPQTEKKERGAAADYFTKIKAGMDQGMKKDFTPRLRKEYMEEGAEFLIDARAKSVETMVFMDKSARPLAGFFRALWKRLWPDEPPPEMKFMVSARIEVGYTAEELARAFSPAKSAFENKIVLLVDETVSSGSTLKNAEEKLKEAFSGATILLGGMAESRRGSASLDIRAPYGSGAYSFDGNALGSNLYGATNEVKESEPESGFSAEVHTKANRGWLAKKTHTYVLRQVGKHETLDENSLEAMDKKIAEEKDLDKKSRLLQIREAYENLME